MFKCKIILFLQMSLVLIRKVSFSKDSTCNKSWLDEDVKEATKALGETQCDLLGIHLWHNVINCCCHPHKSQFETQLKRDYKMMFHELQSITRDTCH